MSASNTLSDHPVVSQREWIAARRELLAKEEELTRYQDRIVPARRELPWLKVEEEYLFDAPSGKVSLAKPASSASG